MIRRRAKEAFMESLRQDIRFGVRMLLKNPGFAAIAVLVLGLGIGANTAIFSLVNAFLIRPLPVEKPQELVSCYNKNTKNPNSYRAFSYPDYVDLRDRNSALTNLTAHNLAMVGITEGDTTRRVFADVVTSNYFDTFGVRPARGRGFSPAEEKPGSQVPVAVVSYQFWRRRGSDPDLVGKTLKINGRIFTVVGIAPEEFTGTMVIFSPEVWLPTGMFEAVMNDAFEGGKRPLAARDNHSMYLIGRLKPGTTIERADAELAVAASQLSQAFPADDKDFTVIARPPSRTSVSPGPQEDSELRVTSVLLISMASVVLLISCLNLANMLLARGSARRKEFAIRLALGGGRGRIMRQLFTEGLLLSILGGAAGLILAYWGTSLLVASMGGMLPLDIVYHSGPDARVLACLMGLCFVSTLISCLGPGLKASRPDVVAEIKEHAGEDAEGKRRRWFARRNVLVVAQLSLSLVLLTAAGLFIRSALRAADANPGFSMDGQLILEIDPALAGYNEARGRDIYRGLIERLGSVPGIESAGTAATVPFGMISLGKDISKAGAPAAANPADPAAGGERYSARYNIVGADYFKTVGLNLLRGRVFTKAEGELDSGSRVAVIDELLAHRVWPNEDPLGKHIIIRGEEAAKGNPEIEIVGVVAPVRENLFESAPEPHLYAPFGQWYQSDMNIHLKVTARGKEATAALMQAIRRETRSFDDQLPVLALKTMRGHLESGVELWIARTGARLFTIFGSVALFLAVVGVYGVKSYTVARRTREIGIRMALGATTGGTLRMVLGEGLILTGAGLAVGLLLAFGVGRILASMLYQVSAADPLIFSVAPITLAAISMFACYVPARRAARVDPMVALRYE
jgi:predicted permease